MDEPTENKSEHWAADGPPAAKPKYKSYKKKYLKIRSRFNKVMNENNGLWEGEQKLLKIARRLEEELDQVRELLVDVNESSSNPPHLKITIGSSNGTENAWLKDIGVQDIEDEEIDGITEENAKYSPESAHAVLREAKRELDSDAITPADFNALSKPLRPYLKIAKSLAYLETKVPHTRRKDVDHAAFPQEIVEESPIGYLDADHEADYLDRLDAELGGRSLADSHQVRSTVDRPLNAARDNPMSALNWLRKYQPQVFLQDADGAEHAPEGKHHSRAAAAGGGGGGTGGEEKGKSKRESTRAKRASVAHEVLDEDGFAMAGAGAAADLPVATTGAAASSRGGKRKRGTDDDTYHPKSGTSSAAAARRKSKRAMLEADMMD